MDSLSLAVIISAIDRATGPVQKVAESINRLTEGARSLSERMTAAGERMTVMGAIAQAGSEKLLGFIEKPVEAASEMQEAMARTAAVTGLAGEQLARLEEHAEAFSESARGFGTSAEQYLGVFQDLYKITHDYARAARAADQAVELGEITNTGAAEAAQLLITAHEQLGVSARRVTGEIAETERLFKIGSPEQYATNLSRIAPVAGALHTSLSQLNALMGETSELMPGGRGAMRVAMVFRELAANIAAGKASLDLTGGMIPALQRVWARIQGLPQIEQLAALKQMGFGSGSQVSYLIPLLEHINDLGAKAAAIHAGAPSAAAAQLRLLGATARANEMAFGHAWNHLMETLGATVLPDFTGWLDTLTRIVTEVREWAGRHRALVGTLMSLAGAIGALTAVAATLLLTFGPILIVGGQLVTLFSSLSGMFAAATEAVELFAAGAGGAMEVLGVLFETNPVGWILTAVAALGVGAYEIYEHWDAIKQWGLDALHWIENWGARFGKLLLAGLAGPFGMIAYEIYEHWGAIKKAAESVAHGIASFFVGHSPPPAGPLHEIGNGRLMEAFAGSLRPAPALGAAYRVAQAVSMTMGAPAGGVAQAPRGFPPPSRVAGAPIVINYSPVVHASSEIDLEQALRRHARVLGEMIEAHRAARERVAWGY